MNLPDFNLEAREVINFVFSLHLTRKAMHSTWPGLPNLISDLLLEIDRLADSCQLPEFTDHGLPHICSVIKRINDWGLDSGWLRNISEREAVILLLSIILHDVGMISQCPDDLGAEAIYKFPLGLYELKDWVRVTHAKRISGIARRIISSQYINDERVQDAILIAQSHAFWPGEEPARLRRRNKALAGVLAVADLLDEDPSRCDTDTLLINRQGSIINKAHWIRHRLIKKRIEIKNSTIFVSFVRPLNTDSEMLPVFEVYKNHLKLTYLYNVWLVRIKAQVRDIQFCPTTGLPCEDPKFTAWKEIPEFQDCLTEQILRTFSTEDFGYSYNAGFQKQLKKLRLSKIDIGILDTFQGGIELMTEVESIFNKKVLVEE